MFADQADVVIQATGALNNWRWPNIPGLHDFGGKLLHSASWDESYDYSVGLGPPISREKEVAGLNFCSQNQRIAVIGNGSSGIQIVPALLPKVAHIDHYVRSRTWIAPSFARDYIEQRGEGLDNCEPPLRSPGLSVFSNLLILLSQTLSLPRKSRHSKPIINNTKSFEKVSRYLLSGGVLIAKSMTEPMSHM